MFLAPAKLPVFIFSWRIASPNIVCASVPGPVCSPRLHTQELDRLRAHLSLEEAGELWREPAGSLRESVQVSQGHEGPGAAPVRSWKAESAEGSPGRADEDQLEPRRLEPRGTSLRKEGEFKRPRVVEIGVWSSMDPVHLDHPLLLLVSLLLFQ